MPGRATYLFCGVLFVFVAGFSLLSQRWAFLVNEQAGSVVDEKSKHADRRVAAAEMLSKRLQESLDAERKEKEQAQQKLQELQRNYSKELAVWTTAQSQWSTWADRYKEWAKTETVKCNNAHCDIPEITLGYDSRFLPKAAELRQRIGERHYATFEELYALVVNSPYDAKDNIWHQFPNAYNMSPSFVFPFSNLRESDIDVALKKLGRPPAFVVEVGSFHGHSAVLMAKTLDKHNFNSTPLLCIDPWSGDLGMLLFRDDWQKKLTPGEIRDGRSTSYYQFMLNVRSQIDGGKIGPKHIIPLAITSTVGARYLLALGLTPDLIYLDSAHEKDETFTEISLYYSLLAKGGVLFGDDFSWASVNYDVKRFAEKSKLELITFGVLWMMQKPL